MESHRRKNTDPLMDKARIRAAVTELLLAIGEDVSRLKKTPELVADSFTEIFGGIGRDPRECLRDLLPAEGLTGPVAIRGISFRSVCEHHLLPFTGKVSLLYEPADKIAGFGNFHELVECAAARPQLQEHLGEQIAEAIYQGLSARAVAVAITARHGCLFARGHRSYAQINTLAARGWSGEQALGLLGPAR